MRNQVYHFAQGTPEWRAVRAGIATASRFEDIVAVRLKGTGELACRRDYRGELAIERLTGIPLDGPKSKDMENGTEREPWARDAYMAATGNLVDQIGFVRDSEIECGGSPDGLVNADGMVEIKCPKIVTHGCYLLDPEPPQIYVAQMQGGMWLNEREWCDFCSYNPDYPAHLRLAVRRVWRDEKYITAMKLAISIFMDEVRTEAETFRNHTEVLP